MLLGFQDQFVPWIEEGSKTHTMREAHRIMEGDRLDLYARPRQKTMSLMFRCHAKRVETVSLMLYEVWYWTVKAKGEGRATQMPICGPHGERLIVSIGMSVLEWDEAEAFLKRDGFRNPAELPSYQALKFWGKQLRAKRGLWQGQLIHWDYEHRWDIPLESVTQKLALK